jgi:hypothetical protein
MAASNDLNSQNFACNQGSQNLLGRPTTIASATTIAPTSKITYVTGTVAVKTITPPLDGVHELILIYTNATPETMVTTGNIDNAIVPTQNLPTILWYDPSRAKYIGAATNLT